MGYASYFPYYNTVTISRETTDNSGIDPVVTQAVLYADVPCNIWQDSRANTFNDDRTINQKTYTVMINPDEIDITTIQKNDICTIASTNFAGDYTIESPEDVNNENEMIQMTVYRTGQDG